MVLESHSPFSPVDCPQKFRSFQENKECEKKGLDYLKEIIKSLIAPMSQRKAPLETPARKRQSDSMIPSLEESD